MTLSSGCGRVSRKASTHVPAPPQPVRIGSAETGVASWYGHPYHGRPTASGEIYDMEKFTAAHRSLPFETWIEVTNLSNGKHVEVRITDRGPFVDGRIVDLSHAAAREIDMLGAGTARVRLKVIAPPDRVVPPIPAADPPDPPARAVAVAPFSGQYSVQAGAFADRGRAETMSASLSAQLETTDGVRVEGPTGRPPLWRVLIGHRLSLDDATALADKIRRISGAALVVQDADAKNGLPEPASPETVVPDNGGKEIP